MSRPQQARPDYQALADFRYEIRRFLAFSEEAARRAGLEPQQHQALLALRGLDGKERATIGVLARRLMIRHHSGVELARRLEARGLIRRSRNDADRREVLLKLTARGGRLLDKLSAVHRSELRSAGRRLLRALRAVLVHANRERRIQQSAGA